MVKLRVTARILPESEYLAHLDSNAPSIAPIRDEKRFHVVVQEPEKWYIGTLAVAVKQKYQNLYKHPLGQIKYLKADEDDCDLDPEEGVLDLLVDEGRALTDKSDQHVTIKVIREQGQAIRQGSLIPDLTPVHYQLSSKPPVPRFEQIGSTLGKRNTADLEVDVHPTKRRRSRLSEIEEGDGVVATIEHDQGIEPIVENSQPTQGSQMMVNGTSPQDDDEDLSLTGWSFSQLGPPTVLVQSVPEMTPSRVPLTKSRSPSVKDPGSRKRFLKPVRDVYAYPESDIDDSQASTSAAGNVDIIPRLVASTTDLQQAGAVPPENGSVPANKAPVEHELPSTSPPKRKVAKAVNGKAKLPAPGSAGGVSATKNDALKSIQKSHSSSSVTAEQNPASKESTGTPSANKSKGKGKAKDIPAAAPPAPPQKVVDTLNTAKSQAAVADSATQLARKSKPTESRMKRQRRTTNASLNANGVQSPAPTQLQHPGQKIPEARATTYGGAFAQGSKQSRRYSTPPPDSPSEQLSQALQESARKSMSTKSTSREENPDDTSKRLSSTKGKGVTSQPPEGLQVPVVKNKASNSKLQDSITESTGTGQGKGSEAVAANLVDTDVNVVPKKRIRKRALTKAIEPEASNVSAQESTEAAMPTIPPTLVRDNSSESHGTKTSAAILPPGMSQAEFDRIVASNSKLNLLSKKPGTKNRSTPSLISSMSRSSEPRNVATPIAKVVTDDGTSSESESDQQPKGSTTKKNKKSETNPSAKKPPVSDIATETRGKDLSTPAKGIAHSSTVTKTNGKHGTPDVPGSVKGSKASTPSLASQSKPKTKDPSSLNMEIAKQSMAPPGPKSATKAPSAMSKSTPKASARSISKSPATVAAAKLPVSSQPTPTPKAASTNNTVPKRPTLAGPNSIYQARSLKELAKISGSGYNSPATSVAGSPAVSSQHRTSFLGKTAEATRAQKKKSLFNNDDDEDDDDDEDSDDSSEPSSSKPSKPSSSLSAASDAKTNTKGNTSTSSLQHRQQNNPRPDPSIRDTSIDDDSGSESGSPIQATRSSAVSSSSSRQSRRNSSNSASPSSKAHSDPDSDPTSDSD